jgi:3-oxoacyl-(acyl-carrier-protein) synthase
MSRVFIHGAGAVSPAGWGVPALAAALKDGAPLPTQPLARPGWNHSLNLRAVPPPPGRPPFLAHPRLRRAGVMAQHTVAAALEALGGDVPQVQSGGLRLGVVVCMMAGGVTYSRRFYEEVLREPATASPLMFPETVFNASASHLSAYLNSSAINYTLVGDAGSFLQGLALAAGWLETGLAEACIVAGAEETDWIVADAVRLFRRGIVYSGGAGALYLKQDPGPVELAAITGSFSFTQDQDRAAALRKMTAELPPLTPVDLLCDGDEAGRATAGHRIAPKQILGEAFVASAAWQCVAACDLLQRGEHPAANVAVMGPNQQAIGARFLRNGI